MMKRQGLQRGESAIGAPRTANCIGEEGEGYKMGVEIHTLKGWIKCKHIKSAMGMKLFRFVDRSFFAQVNILFRQFFDR